MCASCNRTFNALTGTPLAHLQKREKRLDYARAIVDGLPPSKAA
jgi:transposase-like protein